MKEENILIDQIADRASRIYKKYGLGVLPDFIRSELRITHFEVCQLRLKELLNTDEGNFMHDIAGIHRHLDILDGSFRNGFMPRFAKT
jgi:hypothetical protein